MKKGISTKQPDELKRLEDEDLLKINFDYAKIEDISDDEDSKNIHKPQEPLLESQGQIVEKPVPNFGSGFTTDGNDDYNNLQVIIQTDSSKMIDDIDQF